MQYLPSAFHEEAHLYKIVPTYIYTKPQKRVCDVPWTFQTNETSESPGLCFLTSSPWTLLPLEPFTPLLTPEILSSSKIHFLCVYTMEYYSAVKKNSFESVLNDISKITLRKKWSIFLCPLKKGVVSHILGTRKSSGDSE